MTMKSCTKCGDEKSLKEFHKDKRAKSGLQSQCKECTKEWYRSPVGKISLRKAHLKQQYSITLDEYDELLEKQEHCCAICGIHSSMANLGGGNHLAVDHNHDTGQIRGLLCATCNTGIGKFKESVATLQSAINYIQLWRSYA